MTPATETRMTNQLEGLKQHSVIVADTGDIDVDRALPAAGRDHQPEPDPQGGAGRPLPAASSTRRCAAAPARRADARLDDGRSTDSSSASGAKSSSSSRAGSRPRSTRGSASTPRPPRRRRGGSSSCTKPPAIAARARADQDREHLGRHPRRRATRARRHPLQPDAAVQLRAGRGLRRRRRHADLALRRPHLRLVQEGRAASTTSRPPTIRAWPRSPASTSTTRSSATTPR